MSAEQRQGDTALRVIEASEIPTSGNLFAGFIEANRDVFSGYNAGWLNHRSIQSEYRQKLEPYLDEVSTHLKFDGLSDKRINIYRRQLINWMFHGGNMGRRPVEDHRAHAHGGSHGTRIDELRDDMNLLGKEYVEVLQPVSTNINQTYLGLKNDLIDLLTSDYQMLVDAGDFLKDLKDGTSKELIARFFRELIKEDTESRKQGRQGALDPVRETWQERAGKDFNSLTFGRFWETEEVRRTSDVRDWVVFAVRMAKHLSNKGWVGELSTEDVRRSIGEINIAEWPPVLRRAYESYGRSEAASLVQIIRDNLNRLFPSQVKGDGLSDIVEEEPKKKRGADAGISQESHRDGSLTKEAEIKHTYKLGVVKKGHLIPGSRETIPFEIIENDFENEAIEELAKAGKTPQMQEDLRDVMVFLLEDPYRPGTKKMIDRPVGKTYWRRLDPGGIREVRLRDPETRRWRIIYVVVDDVIAISVIMHHSVFDKLGRNDPRAFI